MSMLLLGNHHAPKGTVTSPIKLAILAYLREQGEVTPGQLLQQLLVLGVVSADVLAQKPNWLHNHTSRLRQDFHIHKRTNAAKLLVYALGPGDEGDDEPEPAFAVTDDDELPQSVLPRVAGPRQVNVMHGALYVPPSFAPARAGAMDFARVKSLIGDQLVDFRGAP